MSRNYELEIGCVHDKEDRAKNWEFGHGHDKEVGDE